MPALGLLIILVEIAFAIHAIKRDEWNWVFLILFIPFIGCILYAVMVVVPESRDANRSRVTVLSTGRVKEQHPGLKKKLNAINSSTGVDETIGLAEQLLQHNSPEQAIVLLQQTLSEQGDSNPLVMLWLAKAYFKGQKFQETRQTLEELIRINPDFRSAEGHLLYARVLEQLDCYQEAEHEYEALIQYNPALDVRCTYAVFLKKKGDDEKAKRFFEQILQEGNELSMKDENHYRKWIKVAKMELASW